MLHKGPVFPCPSFSLQLYRHAAVYCRVSAVLTMETRCCMDHYITSKLCRPAHTHCLQACAQQTHGISTMQGSCRFTFGSGLEGSEIWASGVLLQYSRCLGMTTTVPPLDCLLTLSASHCRGHTALQSFAAAFSRWATGQYSLSGAGRSWGVATRARSGSSQSACGA